MMRPSPRTEHRGFIFLDLFGLLFLPNERNEVDPRAVLGKRNGGSSRGKWEGLWRWDRDGILFWSFRGVV